MVPIIQQAPDKQGACDEEAEEMKYMKDSKGNCYSIYDENDFFLNNPEKYLRPCSYEEYENRPNK